MKNEKDVVKFFNYYSEKMLPKDEEQFMSDFKQNISRLPVPASFNETGPKFSQKSTQWLLEKMKIDYKRSGREALISCILASIGLLALYAIVNALGFLHTNSVATVGILTTIVFITLIFIHSVMNTTDK